MTLGPIKPFVDLSTPSDLGVDSPESIQPYVNGDHVEREPMRRPAENLRKRTETLARMLDDTLYTRDMDRALALGGQGTVTWNGTVLAGGDGIVSISDDLWLVPFLTPGDLGTIPPVASKYGTLTLLRTDLSAGIVVTSLRRNYADGNKISVTVQAGSTFSVKFLEDNAAPPEPESDETPRVANTSSHYYRTIVITGVPASTTLGLVITELNALTADMPSASAVVNAALAPGAADVHLLLVPQAKQFVQGNVDAEAHTITPASLESFFASPVNGLREGDSLCIQYASMIESADSTVPLGGRRQSIPENANTSIPAGSFFNSRVNPERLTNALPICKVLNNKLVLIDGTRVPMESSMGLGTLSAQDVTYGGGGTWLDSEPNPPTTVENQLNKIILNLAHSSLGPPRIGAAGVAIANTFAQNQSFAKQLLAIGSALLGSTANRLLPRNTYPLDGGTVCILEAKDSTFIAPVRLYASQTKFMLTVNAALQASGQWTQDKADRSSMLFQLQIHSGSAIEDGQFLVGGKPAGSGTFASFAQDLMLAHDGELMINGGPLQSFSQRIIGVWSGDSLGSGSTVYLKPGYNNEYAGTSHLVSYIPFPEAFTARGDRIVVTLSIALAVSNTLTVRLGNRGTSAMTSRLGPYTFGPSDMSGGLGTVRSIEFDYSGEGHEEEPGFTIDGNAWGCSIFHSGPGTAANITVTLTAY